MQTMVSIWGLATTAKAPEHTLMSGNYYLMNGIEQFQLIGAHLPKLAACTAYLQIAEVLLVVLLRYHREISKDAQPPYQLCLPNFCS